LVRDQVTVEYGSRIRTLVRLFKEEPEFRPSLVIFCGGVSYGNHVSDADAGYIFFRHMCEAQNIDLDGVGIFIDSQSTNDEEAVLNVIDEVRMNYVPPWLEISPSMENFSDEFNDGSIGQRKKINVHFTFISTEYHLCNINDIHHRSPQQSLLIGMELMGEEFKNPTHQNSSPIHTENDHLRNGHNGYDIHDNYVPDYLVPCGLVEASWSFQYATYPYICAKDDAVVFLGKCYLLGEELVPLLMNMKGVVEQKEFFQRDNYLMLASIRRSLVNHVEELHKPNNMLKTRLNMHSRNLQGLDPHLMTKDVVSILEGALLSLGRCVDLVKPAGLHVSSVTKNDWERALRALEHSMSQIRYICDPDRPLRPNEWEELMNDGDSL